MLSITSGNRVFVLNLHSVATYSGIVLLAPLRIMDFSDGLVFLSEGAYAVRSRLVFLAWLLRLGRAKPLPARQT